MVIVTELKFSMDNYLKKNLDSLAYNMAHDYDSLILVSGGGMVRVGKSVIAQQIGKYIAEKNKTPFSVDNITFSGEELINKGKSFPHKSSLIYDEARAELNVRRVLENTTKVLLDFFAECGMYNHCLIMVMPDFFEMPKGIAINRSECLINVLRIPVDKKDNDGAEVVGFERGVFEFYNRVGKKKLYIIGKKNFDNYDIGKGFRSFYGSFPNFWIVDRNEYEKRKLEHLRRDRAGTKSDIRTGLLIKHLFEFVSYSKMVERLKTYDYAIDRVRLSQLVSIADEYIRDNGKK